MPLSPRHLVILLLPGLLGLLASCGGDEAQEGVRVIVRVSERDGFPEGALFLKALGRPEPRVRLVPVPGGEPGLMIAPGAQDGIYAILSDGGWGMLWPGERPPFLTRKGTPIEIPIGRAGSIYLGARDRAQGRVGLEWSVERLDDDGSRHPLEADIEASFFETTAIRIRERPLSRRVWLSGRMSDGRPVQPFETLLTDAAGTRPLLVLVQPARVGRFDLDIAAFGDLDEEGPVPFRLLALGSALPDVRTGEVGPRGIEVLDLPMFGAGVEIRLGEGPEPLVYRFDKDQRLAQGRADLLWVPKEGRVWRPLELPGPASDAEAVFVRPDHAGRYARALVRVEGERLLVLTGEGAQSWWVGGTENRWAHIPDAAGEEPKVAAWQVGARLSGVVKPHPAEDAGIHGPGWRLRLRLREGAQFVDLPGAHIMVSGAGQFRLALPPGHWSARPSSPHGQLGPEVEFELTPGADSTRDIFARPR